MPKTIIDYSKTIIYQIRCDNLDECKEIYVGSTTNFTRRKQQHKRNCNCITNKSYNLKVYKNIRENGGWENWKMIQICEVSCNNKREAECIEEPKDCPAPEPSQPRR